MVCRNYRITLHGFLMNVIIPLVILRKHLLCFYLKQKKNQVNENLSYYLEKFIAIEKQDESVRKKFIIDSWNQMNRDERFVFNKLITGNFRIGVSQKTMVNALAKTVESFRFSNCTSHQWQLGSCHNFI